MITGFINFIQITLSLLLNPKVNKLSGPMLKSALVVKATTVVLWFLRPITGARERSVYHWGGNSEARIFRPTV